MATARASPYDVVWMAESIQGLRPVARVNVQNAPTVLRMMFGPFTRAPVTSSAVLSSIEPPMYAVT